MLICKVVNNLIPNAFLWLYQLSNSHVSIPGKDYNAKYSIWCYFNLSTPLGNKIINLSFNYNCNNGFLYLYKQSNSHVSLNNGNVCFKEPFNKILEANTNSGVFVLGLYKDSNSHVTTKDNEAKYKLYFEVKDTQKPVTEIEFPKNGTIISSTVFEVRFKDYDNGPLLCFYQVGNKVYERKCNSTIYVNSYDCNSSLCEIKSIVIDFAGNKDKKTIYVKLQNVPLLIQILAPEKIVVPISNPYTKFNIILKNTIGKDLNIKIDHSVESLGNIPKRLLPKVKISERTVYLKAGESKNITVEVYGYRIGTYMLNFEFDANGFKAKRTVFFIVSAVIAGRTIAVSEKILFPLFYLI